jgi:hypothetical protein
MDTLSAFARGEAARASGAQMMVFDWDKAAALIAERKPSVAEAGLSGDWGYTGGTIYQGGKPVTDSYTYLASLWATPELELDGERVDCWRYSSGDQDWNADTKWPKSALRILAGEVSP